MEVINLNREFLKNLGLEDDVVDKVMAEYGKSIQELKPAQEKLESVQSEKASLEKQLNELQQTLSSKDEELKTIEDLKNQVETYKVNELKTNIAIQAGIPLESAGRLSGETEEEIKADAEKIAGFVNKKQPLPLKPTEPPVDDKDAGLKQMLKNMKSQGE